jgi:integrating conjugative element protein (TIGR03749 family)
MANEHTLSQQMAESAPTDMVQLTRYAARQLYAPKRLATPFSGVQQVEVTAEPIANLIRGVNVVSTPVGQWRSGQLYVTAVLIKNRSHNPLEIPLEQVRGQWIAATAQHGRIGPAGSETDTTAIYLVCQRRFEACR